MPQELAIDIESKKGWSVVTVQGEVDLATAPSLRRAIEDLYDQGEPVLADLTGVTFMDSTGLRVLIGAHQDLEARERDFAVVPGDGAVARLLDLTGVRGHINVHDSIDQVVGT